MEMEKMEGEEEMRSSLLRDGEGEGLCVTWEGLCVCVPILFYFILFLRRGEEIALAAQI